MNYPLISEYIEAVKSAEDNFDELSYLRPVMGNDRLPIMSVGGFSVVFKMKDERNGKHYAVKCFTKEQKDRAESYRLIADELEFVSSNYLTQIRFLEKELFVDTEQTDETEFPILLMDWVEGVPMDKYIQENIHNHYALELLSFRFSHLAKWLLMQPFAHGDLKPDNILVKGDGSIVLVDYDGMYVPAMKGQMAREMGSPNYRHPLRTIEDFDCHIDDFPLVTIALSLKVIALKPTLFKYGSGENGLLLNESDFRDLKASKIIQEITPLFSDNELCSLFGLFLVVLSQKELDTLSSNLFSVKKPFVKMKESISETRNPDILSNDVVKVYSAACSMMEEERYETAYAVFRSISLTPYGQNGIGVCYAYGYYVEKDMEKAAYWFQKAARKGLDVAQFNLANCYYQGAGVNINRELAFYWYKKADDQGLSIAKEMFTLEGTGERMFKKIEDALNVERWNRISSFFILTP